MRVTTMSNTDSLVVLRDPPPPRRKRSSHAAGWSSWRSPGWRSYSRTRSIRGRGDHPAGVPAINIGPFVVVLPWTETPLPIQLGPPAWIPQGGWIRIAGLPILATLSEGYVAQPGVWRVPVTGLPSLELRSPPIEGVKADVTIALLSADGAVLTRGAIGLGGHSATQEPQQVAVRCGVDDQHTPACQPLQPALAWVRPGARREAEDVMRWGDDALARGSSAPHATSTGTPLRRCAGRRLPWRWPQLMIRTSSFVWRRSSRRTRRRRAGGMCRRRRWRTPRRASICSGSTSRRGRHAALSFPDGERESIELVKISLVFNEPRTLAGAGGFEPPHGGTKIRCLTAWLRPIKEVGNKPELHGAERGRKCCVRG